MEPKLEPKHGSSFLAMLNLILDEHNFYTDLFSGKDTTMEMFSQPEINDPFVFPDNGLLPQYEPSTEMLNDALLSFQDLGLPHQTSQTHRPSLSYKKHSKKPSGAAIFGIHGKELLIPGMGSIDLRDILTIPLSSSGLDRSTPPTPAKEKNHRRLNKIIDPKAAALSKDYIITSSKPTSYKFPPEPTESSSPSKPAGRLLHAPVRTEPQSLISPAMLTRNPPEMALKFMEFTPPRAGFPQSIDEMLDPHPAKDHYFPTPGPSPTKEQFMPAQTTPPPQLQPTPQPEPRPEIRSETRPETREQAPEVQRKRKGTDKVLTLPPGYIDQFIVGPDNDKKYVCNYNACGKVFQRRYNIRSHIQTHLCDRPYKCSFENCTKSFVRQHDLHRHEKIHDSNKYTCPCGKGFTRVDALRRHRERNICKGGFEAEAGVIKPKRKRGRPKTHPDSPPQLYAKLEQTVENALSIPPVQEDYFIFDDKENSSTPSGKNSAPLTPVRKSMPLGLRA